MYRSIQLTLNEWIFSFSRLDKNWKTTRWIPSLPFFIKIEFWWNCFAGWRNTDNLTVEWRLLHYFGKFETMLNQWQLNWKEVFPMRLLSRADHRIFLVKKEKPYKDGNQYHFSTTLRQDPKVTESDFGNLLLLIVNSIVCSCKYVFCH